MFYKNRVLDVRPDRLDLRDREYRPPLLSLPDAWPTRDDYDKLFKRYIDDDMILDQGDDGACTGFGLAAVINYLWWIDNISSKRKKVSPKMLYNMARIYDEWDGEDYDGSSCRGAMKGWHRHGVCEEESWPHRIDKNSDKKYPTKEWSQEAAKSPLGAYYRINKDSIIDMQAAIREVGAIYCSAVLHEGWWIDESDTLPIIQYSTEKIGGHAFAILGYNKDGFIVQNSWGNRWGYHGFATIGYQDWVENGRDAWVAVRGSVIDRSSSPHTFSSQSLQTIGTEHTLGDSSSMSKYPYENREIAPWSEEKAYKHTLVIGNDGRPKLTIVSESDPEKSAEIICHSYIKEWMERSSRNRRIVIYAHGGLNSEKASIDRVRIMAPYFKENGIYPLFVSWKTGFMESITNQIEDQIYDIFSNAGISPSGAKAQGVLSKFQDVIDRSIENFSRKVLVKGVWSEMKENAKYASDRAVPGYPQHGHTRPGAMVILSRELKRLKDNFGCEIHLAGHSAGSILFGHWLDELTKRSLSVESLTLYAPACTVDFANKHYIKACEKGIVPKEKISIYMMDDERERADSVAIYKKSLLYLVSRALEDIHKTPLLGMNAAWDLKQSQEYDIFNSVTYADIKRWIGFSAGIQRHIYDKSKSKVETSLDDDYIDLAHGSFDNDIKVIEQTIREINDGKKPKYKVENLNGF